MLNDGQDERKKKNTLKIEFKRNGEILRKMSLKWHESTKFTGINQCSPAGIELIK